ncbi:hypothetical protein A3840_15825 [Devosia elaeis]|uniref:Polymerase nucleotidyl transferase domain-containing protein n=2 Tax=Devosia elaeis TaxID=1770058 RepID=A0A178HPQ9_9HYPH|nr:hypothetical protein A3840_15825 [Devosia elaeis]
MRGADDLVWRPWEAIMQADDFIGEVRTAAPSSGLFDALFLGGSFGKGQADQWSDVDLLGLAPAERHAAIEAWWRDWLEGGSLSSISRCGSGAAC